MNIQYKQLINNKKVMIPATIILILVIIYLAICFMVGSGDFLSHTTINGIQIYQTVDYQNESK